MRFFQLVSFLITFSVYGQLDPLFFGTYKDELGTEVYSIYTMDEVADDCFIVDYQQFENGQLIRSTSGYGHCDGPNGHMEIKLLDENFNQEVEFKVMNEGLKTMIRYSIKGETRQFTSSLPLEDRLSDQEQEQYYRRNDGVELTFRQSEDNGTYSFSIYQPAQGNCMGGEYSGKLQPLNEELTQFAHTPFSTCMIRLTISADKIEVVEKGAEGLHPNCEGWAGIYLLNH